MSWRPSGKSAVLDRHHSNGFRPLRSACGFADCVWWLASQKVRGRGKLLCRTALCSYKTAKTRIPVFKVEFHPLFTVTTIKPR